MAEMALVSVAPPPAHGKQSASRRGPTGIEVSFGEDEIIVSKTDLDGKLTYANDVFLRVSGYSAEETIGMPHSFIRHPEMPRCVFKLLWDTVQDGREIFAYVVNLTKDGSHYWVFANVTPTFGARGDIIGYHSNRRLPDRSQVERVRSLYQRLVAIEKQHSSKAAAVAASTEALNEIVLQNHKSYEEFVFSI